MIIIIILESCWPISESNGRKEKDREEGDKERMELGG